MKVSILALGMFAALSANASVPGPASMKCVSLVPQSSLGTFTVENIENILRYTGVQGSGIYGISVNSMDGGDQEDPAVFNADGTTSVEANNGCSTDFLFTFPSKDLADFVSREKPVIEGTLAYDDLDAEIAVRRTDKIRCTFVP